MSRCLSQSPSDLSPSYVDITLLSNVWKSRNAVDFAELLLDAEDELSEHHLQYLKQTGGYWNFGETYFREIVGELSNEYSE